MGTNSPRKMFKLASTLRADVEKLGLAPPPPSAASMYARLVTHGKLRKATSKLFHGGHYSQAVEEAFKLLCNEVKARLPGVAKDGMDLMFHAFNESAPVLRLNPMSNESEINEQRGYKFILGGVMAGVRNPRAHQHDYGDDQDTALELLTLANHLIKRIDAAR